jgi:VWFA-related protein
LRVFRWVQITITLLAMVPSLGLLGQGQQPSEVPTIHVTSSLVFLDVTVLDKKGRPVVKGLTRDDFTITEDKKPQRIFSFEAPQEHADISSDGPNSGSKAPLSIFVIDLLNSSFEDAAFIRYSMRKYLAAQPRQLDSPAEMMVVGNQSLEMIQSYTRSRDDLLFALDHLPAALPYKAGSPSFLDERFMQSIEALQEIALQNRGVPGRKNIVWVGHGGPSINTAFLLGSIDRLNRYMHDTTNLLVNSRISLFVIYPGLKVQGSEMHISAQSADADISNTDPFAGDINFGVFVNETGGRLFYNRNDVDAQIGHSEQLGSQYYTLTYQPQEDYSDGKFRHIRVALRDPNLQVVTKAGYFSRDKNESADPVQQAVFNVSEAVRSTIPYNSLEMKILRVVRHPDTRSAEITVQLKTRNLDWQPTDDGKSIAKLILAAASLTDNKDILASKLTGVAMKANSQDQEKLPKQEGSITFTLRVPNRTKMVRVAVETEDGGRIGAADLDRKTIDAAPVAPTPEPQLAPRAASAGAPAAP